MGDNKSFASLGPTLLARKGSARPAMRPQLAPLGAGASGAAAAANLEDLGWNDMGEDAEEQREADILPLTPPEDYMGFEDDAEEGEEGEADVPLTDPLGHVPEVRRQQEDLAEKVASKPQALESYAAEENDAEADTVDAAPEYSAPVVHEKPRPPVVRRPAAQQGRRAAFTLRLDQHRHTQLKLAATLLGRSAQQIVTEALDRFITDTPEIEQLARQVERKRK